VRSHSLPTSIRGLADDFEIARCCWRSAVRKNLAQNLVARSETLLHAVGQHKELVASGECCWPVRDQHNDRSARLEIDDRLVQGRLALAVEVRVRLVEDDKERVGIQGACERDQVPRAPARALRPWPLASQ